MEKVQTQKKTSVKSILFAVYGTLKRGFGNYKYLLEGQDGVKFLGSFQTEPKFTMVSCGGFPAVHCEGNTSIHAEVFEVSNPDVIRNLYQLEGCTGVKGHPDNWYDIEEIETPYGKANMFVFRKELRDRNRIVETGNW